MSRLVKWKNYFYDPYTGERLDSDTDTLVGPGARYALNPWTRNTFYLSAHLYQWTTSTETLVTGIRDSSTMGSPFFGGGHVGWLGENIFFNLGFSLGLGGTQSVDTGYGYSSGSGVDARAMLGMVLGDQH